MAFPKKEDLKKIPDDMAEQIAKFVAAGKVSVIPIDYAATHPSEIKKRNFRRK